MTYLVRWNTDSVTQPLTLFSNALDVAVLLQQTNPGWRPTVERADGQPLSADEVARLREAGL